MANKQLFAQLEFQLFDLFRYGNLTKPKIARRMRET